MAVISQEELDKRRYKVVWTSEDGIELTAHLFDKAQAEQIAKDVDGEVIDIHEDN